MKIVLVPVGSSGDVHPYVGVGLALRARGHDVAIVTSPTFASLIEHVGLRLIPLGMVDQFDAITRHPDLWNQNKGLSVIAEGIKLSSRELYRIIEAERRSGDFILIGSGLTFAARVAHESLDLRFMTMHLQPSCLISVHDSPMLHLWLSAINSLPLAVKRPLLALVDWAADAILAPAARELCTEHGLPPARHITSRWWHSPQRVIGLFPEWFAPPQPDWPNRVFLIGFPLYDEKGAAEVPVDVARFLDTGTPPVVYTAGPANPPGHALLRRRDRGKSVAGPTGHSPHALHGAAPGVPYPTASGTSTTCRSVRHCTGRRRWCITAGSALRHRAPGGGSTPAHHADDVRPAGQRPPPRWVGRRTKPAPEGLPRRGRRECLDTLLGSTSVSARCADLARRVRSDDPLTRTCELIEGLG